MRGIVPVGVRTELPLHEVVMVLDNDLAGSAVWAMFRCHLRSFPSW